MKKSILKGAVYGGAMWFVYGVVELVLSAGLQLLRFPEAQVMSWQWRLIVMLLGAYAWVGLLVGVIAGIFLRWLGWDQIDALFRITAALTLTAAFGANLAFSWPLSRSEYLALALAGGLVVSFSVALVSKGWRELTHFSTSPFIVSLLLLTVPWVSREALNVRGLRRVATSLLLLLVVVAAAAISTRLGQRRPVAALGPAAVACVLFGLFTTGALLKSSSASLSSVGSAPNLLPGKPNVLLITMDTVRADHLSPYGYALNTSPNLQEFARAATTYTRATATSDFTLPTHASIFTGLYPDWNGAIHSPSGHDVPLRRNAKTVAEILRSQGYWTAESVANYGYLGPRVGLMRGFTVRNWDRPLLLTATTRRFAVVSPSFYLRDPAIRLMGLVFDTAPLDRPTRGASDINQSAQTFLEHATKSEKPFFIFLNYMDAHWPYIPNAPFNTRFPGRLAGFRPPFWGGAVNQGTGVIPQRELLHVISQYDGGIAAEDAAIGELLRSLLERGIYDNTLIIVTADHGEGFLEHGTLDHDVGATYQTHVHVPLLIKYPRQQEARQADFLVSQVDLMPTILESVGVAVPPGLQGQSLIRQKPPDEDAVFVMAHAALKSGNSSIRGTRRAILVGSRKLVSWTDGPPELFDLTKDPEEHRNIYRPDDPGIIALESRLAHWISTAPQPSRAPAPLDPTTIERLKSLGYVQ
jgi:arylsulfatase A-like enzyme